MADHTYLSQVVVDRSLWEVCRIFRSVSSDQGTYLQAVLALGLISYCACERASFENVKQGLLASGKT